MKKIILFLFPIYTVAQNNGLTPFKRYPFPTELNAAAKVPRIAWALDEQGVRNIYTAEGPAWNVRKVTAFNKNDGQELTGVSLSEDGKWIVFVRGGEHSGNWDTELPTNPSFQIRPSKVEVYSVPFGGGEVKKLSEGDNPTIDAMGRQVAFIKDGQAWVSAIDGSTPAHTLFATRGTVQGLEWNPRDSSLLFVSARVEHSIIGVYSDSMSPIKWIAPSFNNDNSPHWSPDGKQVVFIREQLSGGAPDSLLAQHINPWSIYVADVVSGKAIQLWQSPRTFAGSLPSTDGETNLHWAGKNRIVFVSYEDGWPHLYSIPQNGGTALLLTPGHFMCEHIRLSADKNYLTCSVNTGTDSSDLERRHVARVSVDKADMTVLTPGSGLEWTAVLTDNNNSIAFISATASRCPVVATMKLETRDHAKFQLLGEDLIPVDFTRSRMVTPSAVTFMSPDGVLVHGDLFLPAAGTTRKPAIVYVHGGPPRQMLLGWHYSDYYSNAYASNQYLASLGFVVLAVNYRLGIGYGFNFHHPAHAGLWGAAEYQDIKAAGEWLQKQPQVDPLRIGIYGGSYGGYLTAMALSHDSRIFAAGVDIHGVHDWVVNASLVGAFVNKFEKAPDYDSAVKTAWLSSPVSAIDHWTSPVLIIHADDDRNVRFTQSIDLINRLEKKGVPYETMMIVDDTHHWMNWNNAVNVYNAAADFFVKKLMK